MARKVTPAAKPQVEQGYGAEATRSRNLYLPYADIFESEEAFSVAVDMPGVARDGVDVTLERRVLTIRGRVAGHVPEGYRQAYAEYGVGDFERVFTLSEDVEQERISATLKDGVLRIDLPKAAAAKAHKVEVRAA